MTKEGYQPKRTTEKPIPPNTGSNVHMKKDGYTWEDLDRSYWEGFDNAKNKMEKRIAELKKELKDANEKVVHLACNQNKDLRHKLTKAKEIIRTFLNMPMPNNEEVFADVGIFLTKAEQFLKEIEK